MSKELWIAAYEELVEQFIDEGYLEDEAEKMAEEQAYDKMKDNFADMGDYYKMIGHHGL